MSWYLNRSSGYVAALFIALLLEPTRCGPQPITSQAAEFPPAIVITEGKTTQGYPFLFGGVSSDERDVMAQRAKDFNVKLVFAAKGGAFVSGVALTIADTKSAQITKVATEGPWFYIQLPPGSYSIDATFKGQSKQIRGLRVLKDKAVQQSFIWDVGEAAEP